MKFTLILLLSLFAGAITAQQQVQIANPCVQFACFHAYVSASLASSASTTLTIQEPATGMRQVQLQFAVTQCATQAYTISQAQSGTAATTTAGTAIALLPTTATAAAKVFTASNVGAGAVTAAPIILAAGPQSVDLSQRTMATAAANYSVTLTNNGASSCTGAMDIYWYEKQ